MLMLGESVLSLLIVSVAEEKLDYYAIILVGILTVVMLQDLYYESQPSHIEGHAMNKLASGSAFLLLVQFTSLALIFLGASYKYMLDLLNYSSSYGSTSYDSNYEGSSSTYGDTKSEYDSGYNATSSYGQDPYATDNKEDTDPYHFRHLGGGIVNPEDAQQSKEYVVWMFCMSLVCVLFFLELMLILHQGVPWKLCIIDPTRVGADVWLKRVLKALMIVLKLALLLSFAFYSTNETLQSYEVTMVIFFGGAIVAIFLFIRIIDWEFLYVAPDRN